MARKPASPEGIPFRLDANLMPDEFNPSPKQVRRWFTSNILTYALSVLCGWTGSKPVAVRATETGLLQTASISVPLEHMDVKSGSAGDTYGTDMTFDQICDRVDIFVWDYAAILKRAAPGALFDDEFEIPANTMYSFDAVTEKINIKNKTAGQVARYQIIGWY